MTETSYTSNETENEKLIRDCFQDVLSTDIPAVFNTSIIGAILGRTIPSGITCNNDPVDLSDFTFPLGHFRDAFYAGVDGKLKRKEGAGVYLSRGNRDGTKFYFSQGNFTATKVKSASIFFDKFTADDWTSHAEIFQSITMQSSCSVKNCPAKRTAKFHEIRIIKPDELTADIQPSILRHNDENLYEVVFKQHTSNGLHSHSVVNGTAMRGQLPFNINDLSEGYPSGIKDPSKIRERCDILKLPLSHKPINSLLRIQVDSRAPVQASSVMGIYAQNLQRVGGELGENYYSQSIQTPSSQQVNNDNFRSSTFQNRSLNTTPWRVNTDIQGMTHTNTENGRKQQWTTRTGLLMSYLDERATKENKNNAAIMTALGFHPGMHVDCNRVKCFYLLFLCV